MNTWFLLALLFALAMIPGGLRLLDDSEARLHREAMAAWEAKDAATAARAWRELADDERATAAACYNRALAETAAGRTQEARVLLERFVARAPRQLFRDRFVRRAEHAGHLRSFLLGNIAWSEGVAAEKLSLRPEAGVPEIDAALIAFLQARDAWTTIGRNPVPAANSDTADWHWPEARENAALADAKIKALEERRREAGAQSKSPGARNEAERRRDQLNADGQTEEVEQDAPGPPPELRPEELKRLLERLARKEAEKRDLRREKRRAVRRAGERDW